VLVSTSGPEDDGEEGWPVVPGPYHELARPSMATVRGVDKTGAPVEVSGTGFFARCLIHESEHLKGILYIDHLPRNRRRRILREMTPFELERQLASFPDPPIVQPSASLRRQKLHDLRESTVRDASSARSTSTLSTRQPSATSRSAGPGHCRISRGVVVDLASVHLDRDSAPGNATSM